MTHIVLIEKNEFDLIDNDEIMYILTKPKRSVTEGDKLLLQEIEPPVEKQEDKYTGQEVTVNVKSILEGPGLNKGWVIVNFKKPEI